MIPFGKIAAAGKVIKGISNRDEYGGGVKGALKGIGKAVTGGDTDDKLDRILEAVENPINETQARVLTPLTPGSVSNPGTMQNATIPQELQSNSMLDPNQ